MHIVLMATGTRGDVQPMIAFGKALRSAGHQVRLVAGANFVSWIESHGLEAYPTVDMEAVMQSKAGIRWVEGKNPQAQLGAMKTLLDSLSEPMTRDFIDGTRDADAIVGGFVSEPFMLSISEKLGIPLVTTALQPYRPTNSGTASLLPLLAGQNSPLNRGMGWIAERLLWSVAVKTSTHLRQQLDLPPYSFGDYRRAVRKIPALYAISPSVVPPIDDANSVTTGYWFLDEPFIPSDALAHFLEAGDPPVYVGFGSMSSSNPAATVQIVSDALKQAGKRGVIVRGWSGSHAVQHPDHVFLLDKAPHSWLFPRMAAVVHHGGAGTTAAGLRAGVPSLLIPHMADQPFWARRLHELGVSVKAIPRAKLTPQLLTARIQELLSDTAIRTRASSLGDTIRTEHGIDNAVEWLQRYLKA